MRKTKTLDEWVSFILDDIKKVKNNNIQGRCWEYQESKNRLGYGRFKFGGKKELLVHRVIYEHFNGKIKKGLFVCHKCDNPPCCNPKHLYAGTPQDNMNDMISRGRSNQPSGEKAYGAKFSNKVIEEIRNSSDPYLKIMKKYKISKGHISGTTNGTTRLLA